MNAFCSVILLLIPGLTAAQTPDSTKVRSTRPNPSTTQSSPTSSDSPLLLQTQLNQLQNNNSTQIRLVDNRYEGLRGTPYLVPDWSKGEIELLTGKTYSDVPLKFDASTQNLVVLRPANRDSIVVYADQIKRFAFQDKDGNTFLYRRFPAMETDDILLKEGYFQVLYAGKNTLLKRVSKVLRKADYKSPYSADVRYDAYQEDVNYYLLRPDQRLAKLKRSRKSLFEALGGNEAALKTFSDKEKLTFKTDADMARLVQFADGL